MRFARNLRLSARALTRHRVRTCLAVAGTAVGVAGVLVLTSIGAGAREQIIRRIASLGRNLLVVNAGTREARGGRTLVGDDRLQNLHVEDAAAILRGSSAVVRAAPAQDRNMAARFNGLTNPTTILGTTPEWLQIRQFQLTEGRFFSAAENTRRARVAVLGSEARSSLFADTSSPLGQIIRIGWVPFEVVGVLASKGISVDGYATEDDRIIVPLETALHRLFALDYLKTIYLEAAASTTMATAEQEVAAILRARMSDPPGAAAFTIQNQRVLLATELAAQRAFRRLIAGLGFLALLVGGVGILSIMLLSVRERRREIGLRVAVGARRPDVAAQFLIESLLLAIAGGVLGLLLGVAAARIVSAATAWNAHISGFTVSVAVTATLAIGVGFGVIPAWRAARLDPILALQSD